MSDPVIITRAQWDARAPKTDPVYVAPSRRQYFVLHHSGAPIDQTVRAIQDWCMDGRGFNDIDYNHLVRGSTGEIYEGRGWDIQGAHTVDYNITGVGVCIIGIDQASDAAKRSVRWLYDKYNVRCGKTLTLHGHRDLATTGTTCPGDRNEAWLRAGLPLPTIQENPMAQVNIDDDSIQRIASKIGLDLNKDASGIALGTRRQVEAMVGERFSALFTSINALPAAFTEAFVSEVVAGVLAGLPIGSSLTPEQVTAATETAVTNVLARTRLTTT